MKQRVLGILLLCALAVIFVPILWQRSNGPVMNVKQIPARPILPQIKPIGHVKKIVFASSEQQTASPAAWVLQLGVFAKMSNAERLVKRLRKKNYVAYSQVTNDDGAIAVYIGPELNLHRLQIEQSKIKKQMKLVGSIMPFKAITPIKKKGD